MYRLAELYLNRRSPGELSYLVEPLRNFEDPVIEFLRRSCSQFEEAQPEIERPRTDLQPVFWEVELRPFALQVPSQGRPIQAITRVAVLVPRLRP